MATCCSSGVPPVADCIVAYENAPIEGHHPLKMDIKIYAIGRRLYEDDIKKTVVRTYPFIDETKRVYNWTCMATEAALKTDTGFKYEVTKIDNNQVVLLITLAGIFAGNKTLPNDKHWIPLEELQDHRKKLASV